MQAEIIQAEYDKLDDIAGRFAKHAESMVDMRSRIENGVQALQSSKWEGQGSAAFFTEMNRDVFPIMMRLTNALEQAQSVTLQTKDIFQAAEEEAKRPFQGKNSLPDYLENLVSNSIDQVGDAIIALGDYGNWIQAGLGLFGLASLNFRYANSNVIVSLGRFLKGFKGFKLATDLAGLNGITRIKPENVPWNLTKRAIKGGISKLDVAIAVLQTGGQWIKDFREYRNDPGQLVSALAVDTLLVGGTSLLASYVGGVIGTAGGSYIGGWVGGAIGGVLGSVIPGAGNVAGAAIGATVGSAIGGIAGKFIAGWTADKYVVKPMLESDFRENVIVKGGKFIDNAWDEKKELLNSATSAIQNIPIPKLLPT